MDAPHCCFHLGVDCGRVFLFPLGDGLHLEADSEGLSRGLRGPWLWRQVLGGRWGGGCCDFVVDESWNKLPQQLFGLEGIWLQSRVDFVHVCLF